jgi:hypothetical protein
MTLRPESAGPRSLGGGIDTAAALTPREDANADCFKRVRAWCYSPTHHGEEGPSQACTDPIREETRVDIPPLGALTSRSAR